MGGCISTPKRETETETKNGLESTRRKEMKPAKAPTKVHVHKPSITGFRTLVKIIEEEQMRAIAEHEASETETQEEPVYRQADRSFARRSLRT